MAGGLARVTQVCSRGLSCSCLGRAPPPAPPVRVAVRFPFLDLGEVGGVLGVPSPWVLTGAPAGRWGTRPCRVWMLLASGVWSLGGRFQNPRVPGWCRLTGGRVGPRRLWASPTRWWGSQAWGGGAPCRQAELVLEWGPRGGRLVTVRGGLGDPEARAGL